MKASWAGLESTRASEPAVVNIRSAVSMLSLIRTGMPNSGPRERAGAIERGPRWPSRQG